MTKPGNDEGYKDQLALQWIHDGLQKEFQICNYINTTTGSRAYMVYSKP